MKPLAKMIYFHQKKKKKLIFGAATPDVVSISITFHFAKKPIVNQTKKFND
jgi:hypothetical protein